MCPEEPAWYDYQVRNSKIMPERNVRSNSLAGRYGWTGVWVNSI